MTRLEGTIETPAERQGAMKIVVLIGIGIAALFWLFADVPRAGTFTPMAGEANFALLIEEGATGNQLASAAAEKCGSETYCTVMGWRDPALVASALPLDDAQLAGLQFQFSQNLATGFRKTMFNCDAFPRDDRDECL